MIAGGKDMFWDSYAVVGGSPARISSTLLDEGPWNECRFTFRSRRTGDAVTGAFCEGPPFIRDRRVSMRALYLPEHSSPERMWVWMLSILPSRSRPL